MKLQMFVLAVSFSIILFTYLFKSANQLLLAQGQVSHWPHHTAGRCEEEQTRVQAGLACSWYENNLSPGRNSFFSEHLKEQTLNLRFSAHTKNKQTMHCSLFFNRLQLNYLESTKGVHHNRSQLALHPTYYSSVKNNRVAVSEGFSRTPVHRSHTCAKMRFISERFLKS